MHTVRFLARLESHQLASRTRIPAAEIRSRLVLMPSGIYITGNIVTDCLIRPVDDLPTWGTTTFVDSIDLHLGGNGAASAYAAGMMGVPVRLAGAVGDDSFGQFALGRLREKTRLGRHDTCSGPARRGHGNDRRPRKPQSGETVLPRPGSQQAFRAQQHSVRPRYRRQLLLLPFSTTREPAGISGSATFRSTQIPSATAPASILEAFSASRNCATMPPSF